MPNRRAQPIQIRDFEPRGAVIADLPAVARPGGESAESAMKVAEKVATAFGRIADEAALVEGARAGRLAGLEDPNYRPIGRSSLRGQSFETAANQSYAYSLSTRLREDMDAVYEANKSSPTQLSVALDQLKRQFAGDLFPEVRGPFDVEFSRLRYSYENTARRQHETKVKAEASDAFNANLLTRLASIDRITYGIELDPNGAVVLTSELAGLRDLINQGIRDGRVTQVAGQKIIGKAADSATSSMVQGTFDSLPDRHAREAYIRRIDQQFLAGEGDVGGLDAGSMRTLKSGLLRRLNEEVKNETRVEQIAERSAREKVEREGYKLLSQGGLDQRWLDDNADNLSGTAFRRLSQGLSSRRFGRNDPSVYGDLLLRATDDPDGVLRDATAAYSRGQIDKPAYDRLTAAAERRESEGDNRPGWALDIRRDMIRRLRPSNLQDPDQARRQLDAVFSFDDWLTANPQTTREQARDQMDLLVDRHRDTAARNERSTLPIPMFAQSSRDAMSPDALPAIADRLRRAHAAGEVDETIFLEQVENLQRWRDVLQRAPRGAR